MVHIPHEMIVSKLIEETGLSREDIDKRVQSKMKELSGLLSPEGAAHIIANELGVDVHPSIDKPMKIGEILEGMRNITINAKIVQKYEIREFERDGSKGRVASIVVGDETGRIRVTFWHGAVDMLEGIDVDDIIQIKNVYARNNQGRVELSSNDSTKIKAKPKGVLIEGVADPRAIAPPRCMIKDAKEGSAATLLGVVVQVFKPTFFEVCPECNRRAKSKGDVFVCDEHGEVEPKFSYVMNMVLDDGSGSIRTVLFRENALQFVEKTHEEMIVLKNEIEEWEALRSSLLGKMLKASGRIVKNAMFERTELVVDSLSTDIDIDKELEQLKKL
jgi:replication factor A1